MALCECLWRPGRRAHLFKKKILGAWSLSHGCCWATDDYPPEHYDDAVTTKPHGHFHKDQTSGSHNIIVWGLLGTLKNGWKIVLASYLRDLCLGTFIKRRYLFNKEMSHKIFWKDKFPLSSVGSALKSHNGIKGCRQSKGPKMSCIVSECKNSFLNDREYLFDLVTTKK